MGSGAGQRFVWVCGGVRLQRMLKHAACRFACGLGLTLALSALLAPVRASADPIKGTATLTHEGKYARLLIHLADDVEWEARQSGSIVIISFKKPVDVPVDRLSEGAPDFVATARRDPDGTAIRLALAKRLKINSMMAGERIYVDFLPENWVGELPGLPPEVIRELAERARTAERLLKQRLATEIRRRPVIRVKISHQPTFTRYVFDLDGKLAVKAERNDDKLVLRFDKTATFDLADAIANAPAQVMSITQKDVDDQSLVTLTFLGEVGVKSFIDEKALIVDVAIPQSQVPAAKPKAKRKSESRTAPKVEARIETETPARIEPVVAPVPAPAAPPVAQAQPAAAANGMPATQAKAMALASAKSEETPAPAGSKDVAVNVAKSEAGPANPTPATEKSAKPDPAPAVVQKSIPARVDTPKIGPAAAVAAPSLAGDTITAHLDRSSGSTQLTFPFDALVPAAAFRRADTLWVVFDTKAKINLDAIRDGVAPGVRGASLLPLPDGVAVRIHLDRPLLASLAAARGGWVVTLADNAVDPPLPLSVARTIVERSRANISIAMDHSARLHIVTDPDVGDRLEIITAPAPARGFLKQQNLVDLHILQSVHGVVFKPLSDGLTTKLSADKIVIDKPGGLVISPVETAPERATTVVSSLFDTMTWNADRDSNFNERHDELLRAVSSAVGPAVKNARLDLVRFYFARGFFAEAKGVLDVALSQSEVGAEDPKLLVMRGLANLLLHRPDDALIDLKNSLVGNSYESQLWTAMAYTRKGKWAEAREKFKNVEFAISTLPIDLQRRAIFDAARASLEVRDFATASNRINELDIVGALPTEKPIIDVMRGRLAEGLGRIGDAMVDYEKALSSGNRMAIADARVHIVALKLGRQKISTKDAFEELETIAVAWRGDETEVHALQLLARLYAEDKRYRDALLVTKMAAERVPTSPAVREMQDEASTLFSELFLSDKGANIPPVDALAMFFEFRHLTPIGRRGDEMIRRLADRLASVDLLDQATELLQYQVDNRLQGAARAQVATGLAMYYLMNRKPARAIAALHATRIVDLAGDLRQERLLLEARAQSDLGRHNLALDIISNVTGREAIRLRSDIYWAARRWREASEQLELLYGERWKDFKPLTTPEKSDILRAAIGYSLAEDMIGIARFREKYAPKMTAEADRKAFNTAAQSISGSSADIGTIAKMAASFDTLDGFLRDMKMRFADTERKQKADAGKAVDPRPTGSLPATPGLDSIRHDRKKDLSPAG